MATISATINPKYSELKINLMEKLEGNVLTAYVDSRGIPSIGIGL